MWEIFLWKERPHEAFPYTHMRDIILPVNGMKGMLRLVACMHVAFILAGRIRHIDITTVFILPSANMY